MHASRFANILLIRIYELLVLTQPIRQVKNLYADNKEYVNVIGTVYSTRMSKTCMTIQSVAEFVFKYTC